MTTQDPSDRNPFKTVTSVTIELESLRRHYRSAAQMSTRSADALERALEVIEEVQDENKDLQKKVRELQAENEELKQAFARATEGKTQPEEAGEQPKRKYQSFGMPGATLRVDIAK